MVDWVRSLFSSAPSLQRVRPIGLVLLIVGALVYIIVGKRLAQRDASEKQRIAFKCACLVICAAGALIAIY